MMKPLAPLFLSALLAASVALAAAEYGAKCAPPGARPRSGEYREYRYPNYRRQIRAVDGAFRTHRNAVHRDNQCTAAPTATPIIYSITDGSGVTAASTLAPGKKSELTVYWLWQVRPAPETMRNFWVGTGTLPDSAPFSVGCSVPNGVKEDRIDTREVVIGPSAPCGEDDS